MLCLTFLLQTFLSSSSCPEIHGYLHAKEHGRKSWKKFYFVLRRSGLYFSNKGTSKVCSDPSHTCSALSFWLAKTLRPLIPKPQSLQGLALIVHNTTCSYLLDSLRVSRASRMRRELRDYAEAVGLSSLRCCRSDSYLMQSRCDSQI